MTTARSSFSFARMLPVYRNILRRNRGSALFYGALGFIFLPLQYFLTILQHRNDLERDWFRWSLYGAANLYNGFSAFFFTVLMLIVPLVIAVSLFSYLHNRRSVDVYHSLPLTRYELYCANCAAGLTLVWGPLAVNFAVAALISLMLPEASMLLILTELLCWMVITFAIFAITVFAAVQLGTDFDTVIFSLGLNGALAAVFLMFTILADGFIYGFSAGEEAMRFSYRLSPISLIVGRIALSAQSMEYILENNRAMVVWLFAGIVILAVGAWRYRCRKSEQAESVGEMGPLQIFLRAVATLLGGTGLGIIFCAVFEIDPNLSKGLTLFCIAVGSMLVYFIGDVILTRSVRSIPRALPAALLTTLGVCVLVGGTMFDLLGISRWQPQAEEIASMRLPYYQNRFVDQPTLDRESRLCAFTDPEAVAMVLSAQKKQIELHNAGVEESKYYNSTFNITYTLKNGREVNRRYPVLYPEVLNLLLPLETDDEMITQTHAAFAATASMVQKVTVKNALGSHEETLNLKDTEAEQLLLALREDLLAQPLEELRNGTTGICTLKLELKYPVRGEDSERYEFAEKAYNLDPIKEKEFFYAVSETVLTASYRNTLLLLQEFGASDALENDWNQVKVAYAMPFNRSYGGMTTVAQTDFSRVTQTQDDLECFLNPENGQNLTGLTMQSFALSPMELAAVKNKLTAVALTYNDPFAVLGVAAGEDREQITGYFLLPVSALPEHLKTAVVQMVKEYYGEHAVSSWGYARMTTAAPGEEMMTNSTTLSNLS